ncbi:MAG: hypothetical protein JXB49_11040 [Bacteroidales bacterium]|nr:hypothetical protein [Bacteroidales bacterium]
MSHRIFFIILLILHFAGGGFLYSQDGPGGVGSNNGSSELTLWLRADKNVSYDATKTISAWSDYSGYGNNLSSSAEAPSFLSNTLNSLPVVYFSTNAMGLERSNVTGSDIFSAGTGTVLCVLRSVSGNTFFNWQNTTSNKVGLGLSSGAVQFDYPNTVAGTLTGTTSIISSYHFISALKTAANQYVYVDGDQDATQANALSLNTAVDSTFYLGSYNATTSNGWIGYMAELIIFNTELNSAERAIVENYLSAKYALAFTTSGNDLYNGDAPTYNYDCYVVGIGNESDGNHTLSNSSGFRISEQGGSLGVGEYVFAGHNNSSNTVVTTDLPGGVQQRWSKDWYVDVTETDGVNLRISFDFSEGIDGGTPGDISDYALLYRSGTSGNYTVVTPTGSSIENTDQVYFNVSVDDGDDGFYTLGTQDMTNSPLIGGQTWYTYITNDWNTYTTWTLDPDGSQLINPYQQVPGAADTAIVLNGTFVNIDADNATTAKIEIRGGGIVTIDGTTSGHDFGEIIGSGRIQLEEDNFPAGDTSDFITRGTVEYIGGSDITVTEGRAYYNLIINLDDANDAVIFTDSIIVNNDLTIQKGEFQINGDGTSYDDVVLTVTVLGNISVQSNGKITVGTGNPIDAAGYEIDGTSSTLPDVMGDYHKMYHQLYAYGDITNNGTIQLTNQSQPDYIDFTATGAVSLYMMNASNNTFNIYGITNLYNFIIDKGTDRTYILTIYSSNSSYFALYGPNVISRFTDHFVAPFNEGDFEIRKALWIYHGTLKLTGNIFIPTLNEREVSGASYDDTQPTDALYSDFCIGASGALWIAGDNVKVSTTAVTGDVTATGIINTTGSQALGLSGRLRVTAGTFTSRNSGGIYYWPGYSGELILEGGTITLSQLRNTGYGTGRFSYIQSGGDLIIRGDEPVGDETSGGEYSNGYGLFNLNNGDCVFQMSGGDIYIYDNNGDDEFDVLSDEGNYSVTGGKVTMTHNGGQTASIYSTANLWDLDIISANSTGTYEVNLTTDLTVSNDLFIDDYTTLDVDNGGSNSLNIGGDLTMGSTAGTNNAALTSIASTINFIGSGNSLLNITNTGNADVFHVLNLTINKNNSSNYLSIRSPGRTVNPPVEVDNLLTVSEGIFDYGPFHMEVNGGLTNAGIMGTDTASGYIELTGSNAQYTVTTSSSGNPSYGHIYFNDGDVGDEMLLVNNARFKQLTIYDGEIYIDEYLLTIDTNQVINGNPGVGFQTGKMIKLSGDHGARGIKLNLAGSYTSTSSIVYPIGTEGATDYYSPLVITFSGNEDITTGFMTTRVVNREHPASSNNVYDNYWDTYLSDDFSVSPNTNVTYNFYSGLTSNTGNEQYKLTTTWINGDATSISSIDPLDFSLNFVTGTFTAGTNGFFNSTKIFNSIQTGPWGVNSTWDNNPSPGITDIAIIHTGHTVTMGMNHDVGDLTIEEGGVLDIVSTTGHTMYTVSGSGRIRISTTTIPTGNFDGFLNNDTAIWEYYGTTNYTIPNPANLPYYPNLLITGSNGKTLPNTDLLVRKNLYIDGETVTANANDDIDVYDSVIFDNAGILRFPSTGTCALMVGKTIDMSGSSSANTIDENTGGTPGTSHSIILEEDIVMNDNAVIDLYGGTRKINLYFRGDGNSQITSSAATIAFNNLYIEKDTLTDTVTISNDFTLTDDTDRALHLTSGTLILDNSNIDISLTSGDGDFTIPSAGELILRNATCNVSGASTGILLYGKLTLENSSEMLMNDGTNENYIEYKSTGHSEINISDNAVLNVGSQIRRGTIMTGGALNYVQTGGTLIVGNNNAAQTSRAMLEVLNSGSNFTFTGGDIYIARAQSTTSPALYLDPATSTLSSGQTITFGNANTPASQSMGIYSAIDLPNIALSNAGGNNPEVKLYSLALTIDTLTIGSGTGFRADGIDLSLNGDFVNSGNFYHDNNITSFVGTVKQNIVGTTAFYDLTVNKSDTLELSSSTDITVAGDLTLSSGVLDDNENSINVAGGITNSSVHYSPSSSAGGIVCNGASRQELYGTGTFGRFEISNPSDAAMNNNITLNNSLILTNGSLVVRTHLLTLGADIQLSGTFSENNMIITNGAVSDNGIKRMVNAGEYSSFFFPVGVPGKYTPVEYIIDTNTIAGSITVIPVNNVHPTATSPDDALQYYWRVINSGLGGFTGVVNFNYLQEDVSVTSTNLESDYIPARLISSFWSKFGPEDVDDVNNIIEFNFSGTGDISGDYTCAIDTALPDTVPVFTTVKDGDWDDENVWFRTGEINPGDNVPENGPDGQIVVINDSIYTNGNLRSAYRTTINQAGKLYIGTTLGHYLGDVDGSGTIQLDFGRLPAGRYEDFFDCSGGTIEYSGTGNYYISDEGSTIRRLILSGTGKRIFPLLDFTICDTLSIRGATLDNTYNNDQITINGYLERISGGSFLSGTSSNARFVFSGSAEQTIEGSFTGNNAFNRVTLNNTSTGVTLNDTIEIQSVLTLTDGTINTTDDNIVYLPNTASVSPSGGSSASFINGPLLVDLDNGFDYNWPIGEGTRFGQMGTLGISTSGTQGWKAEYVYGNPHDDGYDTSQYDGSIAAVSHMEYWKVTGPAGTADVRVRWDATSDMNGLSVGDINDIVIAQWNGTLWTEVGSDVSGTDINGTVSTEDATAPTFTAGQDTVFTLASYVLPGPTAVITSTDFYLCTNEAGYITIELTGDQPWYVIYEINGANRDTTPAIASTPYLLPVTDTGTYTLAGVWDANDPSGVTSGSCHVQYYTPPDVDIENDDPDANNIICEGDTLTFTANVISGVVINYEFILEGVGTLQSGSESTYSTATLTDGDGVFVVATSDDGCYDTSSTNYITVNPYPTPLITGDSTVCEGYTIAYTTPNTGNTFVWTITNGSLISDDGLGNIIVQWDAVAVPSASVTGYVEVEETMTGCSTNDTHQITIYRRPNTGPNYHIPNPWSE